MRGEMAVIVQTVQMLDRTVNRRFDGIGSYLISTDSSIRAQGERLDKLENRVDNIERNLDNEDKEAS